MKKFLITGGLLGFLIGLIFGWFQDCDWPSLLWRASVAALCAGLLLRWWAGVWIRSVRQTCERLAANAQTEAPQAAAVSPKS